MGRGRWLKPCAPHAPRTCQKSRAEKCSMRRGGGRSWCPLWRRSAWPRRKITKKRVDHDKRASQGNAGRTGWMMMSSPEQREENIKVSFWSQEPPTAHKQRNGSQLPCSAASAGQHAGRGRTAGVRPPTPDSSKERAPESIGRAHRGRKSTRTRALDFIFRLKTALQPAPSPQWRFRTVASVGATIDPHGHATRRYTRPVFTGVRTATCTPHLRGGGLNLLLVL